MEHTDIATIKVIKKEENEALRKDNFIKFTQYRSFLNRVNIYFGCRVLGIVLVDNVHRGGFEVIDLGL